MTTRPFNVIRRRANFVDILMPKLAGVKGYRLRSASNFDASFTDLLTADIAASYLGPGINRGSVHMVNNNDHVRAIFNPTSEGLTDNAAIWLKFQPVDFAGTPGTESLPILLLPDDAHSLDGRFVIRGNAPSAANITGSQEIGLPRRVSDLTITNLDTADELLVAFTDGGPEHEIAATETFTFTYGALERLIVRGDSAIVEFTATFTNYLPL